MPMNDGGVVPAAIEAVYDHLRGSGLARGCVAWNLCASDFPFRAARRHAEIRVALRRCARKRCDERRAGNNAGSAFPPDRRPRGRSEVASTSRHWRSPHNSAPSQSASPKRPVRTTSLRATSRSTATAAERCRDSHRADRCRSTLRIRPYAPSRRALCRRPPIPLRLRRRCATARRSARASRFLPRSSSRLPHYESSDRLLRARCAPGIGLRALPCAIRARRRRSPVCRWSPARTHPSPPDRGAARR